MQNKLSVNNYHDLNADEKKKYILKIMELEEFWILGYVKNTVRETNFFYIENVINPYTTLQLNWDVFSDINLNNKIKCKINSLNGNLNDDTLVLAKISLNFNKEFLSKNGALFNNVSSNDIKIIENTEKIFEVIEKTKMDLPIIALMRPSYHERSDKEFDDLVSIVENLAIKERQALKELKEAEDKKIEEKMQELILKEKDIKKEFEKIKHKELEQIKKNKLVSEKIEKINELGFSFKKENFKNVIDELPKFKAPNNKELIMSIKEQLKLRGYHYNDELLRQFLLSLVTGEMIILVGPSGTGKTTIVKQLAEVIDANCEIIPVQPSWTDKQDLVGFYNPIRKLFVPSPFLDCFVKAKDNPDKLFFICLDEMNLAQIEYYLADILSIREVSDEKLRLYSDLEYEQNISEIRWFIQHTLKSEKPIDELMSSINVDSMKHFELTTQYSNMKKYPPQMEIPSNIRIIGTMNIDGTVQSISPKIIDRSFIIPVLKQNESNEIENVNIVGRYPIHPNNFVNKLSNTSAFLLQSELSSIQKELKNFNIQFNNRVEKHLNKYSDAAKDFKISLEEQIDDLILLKFLPRIHNTFEDLEINNLINKIELEIGKDSQSLKKIEYMKSQIKDIGLLSYWS